MRHENYSLSPKRRIETHSKRAGNVHVMVNGTESQFFGVFKGYILYMIIIQEQEIINVYLKA